VLGQLGRFVWATGETTWSEALGAQLDARGWTLGAVEIGTGGSLHALLGDVPWLRFDESIALEAPAATAPAADEAPSRYADDPDGPDDADTTEDDPHDDLLRFAQRARELGGAEVGLAVRARPRTGDTAVSIAIVTPDGTRRIRRVVFLSGPMGRSRVALTAAAVLLETLREPRPTE
jgi:hypothetical protein